MPWVHNLMLHKQVNVKRIFDKYDDYFVLKNVLYLQAIYIEKGQDTILMLLYSFYYSFYSMSMYKTKSLQ